MESMSRIKDRQHPGPINDLQRRPSPNAKPSEEETGRQMSNDDQGYRRQQDQAPVFAAPARLRWSLYSFWLNFRIHKGGLAAHRGHVAPALGFEVQW